MRPYDPELGDELVETVVEPTTRTRGGGKVIAREEHWPFHWLIVPLRSKGAVRERRLRRTSRKTRHSGSARAVSES